MDDLMTGINVPSGTGGVGGGQPQHSQLSAQGVYDPTGGAAASAPTSTSDDILSALDQVNNAFGHLGENSTSSAANAQPAAQSLPQSTGYGTQQSSYGQQSAPQSTGYGAQQSSYGQQSAPPVHGLRCTAEQLRTAVRTSVHGLRRTAEQLRTAVRTSACKGQ